jgi:hypothetical protein
MGNMFGMNSTSDDEQEARLITLERRVLELEQKVFLGHIPEVMWSPYGKRFEPDPPPPPPPSTVSSNPMLITPLQNPDSCAPFYSESPLSISWSQ